MYVSAPIFGKVYDNYGPAPLLYIGAFAHVFGLIMTSLGQKYYQILLAQSLCSALGAAAVFYAGNNPIGTWFFKRRALAYGVAAAGASVSGVILPVMISRLLPKIGFGWTMRVCSFMFLLLLIFAALTVKPRTRPEPRPWVLGEFLKPMKERLFLFNFLGYFFFVMGVWIPFNFIVTAAQHYGMDENLASYQIAILNGTRQAHSYTSRQPQH
jgi:MFS family permease